MKMIALELGQHQIRCNALCPGFVDTPFNAGFETQMGGRGALEHYVGGTIPMGRWGTPEDVGKAVASLARGALPFSTGEVLNVDGGFHLRRL